MTKKRNTSPLPMSRQPSGKPRALPVAIRFGGTDRELALPPAGPVSIGNGPQNHIVVDDAYVSGAHCVLNRVHRPGDPGERMVVRDLRSRNGTFVNGTRTVEGDVAVGSRIVIGATTLLLLGNHSESSGATVAEHLVGEDPHFRAAIELATKAARTSAHVLILGESGSGKELVARLVHEVSHRCAAPFVAVNCGALAREVIESELFGHERGAFTGADRQRSGLFAQAHGGTLFLDEIGEMPIDVQPRLLRALETRRVRSVGGEMEREVDVRVVAATHRDLRAAVREGSFRTDLFHRLAGMVVRLPPLRERRGDIPLLARRFVSELARDHGALAVSDQTLAEIAAYEWPGNVRELKNALRQAALVGEGEIRAHQVIPNAGAELVPQLAVIAREGAGDYEPPDVDAIVKLLLSRTLDQHGSIRRAAAAMGVPKSTFHDRVRRAARRIADAQAEAEAQG
jgi:DNA-binding NtrC family response regulator